MGKPATQPVVCRDHEMHHKQTKMHQLQKPPESVATFLILCPCPPNIAGSGKLRWLQEMLNAAASCFMQGYVNHPAADHAYSTAVYGREVGAAPLCRLHAQHCCRSADLAADTHTHSHRRTSIDHSNASDLRLVGHERLDGLSLQIHDPNLQHVWCSPRTIDSFTRSMLQINSGDMT